MEHKIYRVKVEFLRAFEAKSDGDAKQKVIAFLKNHPEELTVFASYDGSFYDLEPKEGKK